MVSFIETLLHCLWPLTIIVPVTSQTQLQTLFLPPKGVHFGLYADLRQTEPKQSMPWKVERVERHRQGTKRKPADAQGWWSGRMEGYIYTHCCTLSLSKRRNKSLFMQHMQNVGQIRQTTTFLYASFPLVFQFGSTASERSTRPPHIYFCPLILG